MDGLVEGRVMLGLRRPFRSTAEEADEGNGSEEAGWGEVRGGGGEAMRGAGTTGQTESSRGQDRKTRRTIAARGGGHFARHGGERVHPQACAGTVCTCTCANIIICW